MLGLVTSVVIVPMFLESCLEVHGADNGAERSSSSDHSRFDKSNEEGDYDDLDTCPSECSLDDYETACQLREKRIEIEVAKSEVERVLELTKREFEATSEQIHNVDLQFELAKSELVAFQLEKQRRLNELETLAILRLGQIVNHDNQTLLANMDDSLVFKRVNLQLLNHRVRELNIQKSQQRQQLDKAKTNLIMLQKNKIQFQKELDKLDAACQKEMIKKFGKITDIGIMESAIVNPKLEELSARHLVLKAEFDKEERQMDDRIKSARDACIGELRENTKYFSQLQLLTDEKYHYQYDLDSAGASGQVCSSSVSDGEMEVKELDRVVRQQQKEIDLLEKEIRVLHKKDEQNRSDLHQLNDITHDNQS